MLSSRARQLPGEGPHNSSPITPTTTDDVRRICFAHCESVPCVNLGATVRSLGALRQPRDDTLFFCAEPRAVTTCLVVVPRLRDEDGSPRGRGRAFQLRFDAGLAPKLRGSG